MKRIIYVLAIMLVSGWIAACGVDRNDSAGEIIAPVDVSGPWRIVLLPARNTCAVLLEGFALQSPIDIPLVSQDGNTFQASFQLNNETVSLSGSVIGSVVNFLMEKTGLFIESYGGTADGTSITGSFNGQKLPGGCSESGMFVAAVRDVATPVVTGEWDITFTGAAQNCDSAIDNGPFVKFISNASVFSSGPNVIGSVYQDPGMIFNTMIGVVVGKSLAATINDIVLPPTRSARISGTIEPFSQTIAGELKGRLAFDNGFCEISGGAFSVVYR